MTIPEMGYSNRDGNILARRERSRMNNETALCFHFNDASAASVAGLLSVGVHELIEIGAIPFGGQTLFDLSGVLPHSADSGNLLG